MRRESAVRRKENCPSCEKRAGCCWSLAFLGSRPRSDQTAGRAVSLVGPCRTPLAICDCRPAGAALVSGYIQGLRKSTPHFETLAAPADAKARRIFPEPIALHTSLTNAHVRNNGSTSCRPDVRLTNRALVSSSWSVVSSLLVCQPHRHYRASRDRRACRARRVTLSFPS